tara:strand:+ start:635 stop:1195 length:561 start_codon:yes stop_codon:yes gene_type:complete
LRTLSITAATLITLLTTGCVNTPDDSGTTAAAGSVVSANPQTLFAARLQPASGLETSVMAGNQLRISFPGMTAFSHDGARLSSALQQQLTHIVESLKGINYQRLAVLGHTDSSGQLAYNNKLSQQRAEQVKAFMLQQGLAAETIAAEGRGPAEPIADNNTAEGKAANRRVELVISFEQPLTAAVTD